MDGNEGTNKGGDPVDVVSGQMLTSAIDIVLPGVLPLVLRRAYASDYRHGRLFGPGWSSTLDQRVVIDDDGIHYLGDDSQHLAYQVPAQPGQQVLPAVGAPWPLRWDRKTDLITIADVDHHTTLHFAATRSAAGSGGQTRFLTRAEDRHGNWIQFQRDQDHVPTDIYHHGGYHLVLESGFHGDGLRVEGIRLLDGGAQGVEVARFAYDAYGRLAEITDSSDVPYIYEYDRANRITAWIDRLGYRYEYAYDEGGRVVRGTGPDGYLSAGFDYDVVNRVTTVTNSLGHEMAYHYDEHSRVVKVVDPLGRATTVERDARGNLVSSTDALGHTETFVRDPQGRILASTRRDGAAIVAEYGTAPGPTRITDANGSVWQSAYDDRGNLVEGTDPLGATTRYAYDEHGALASLAGADGAIHTFEADRAGSLTSSKDSLGSRVVFERDAFGRVATMTNALGGVTRFEWSVEGRLLARAYPDGAHEEFRHDTHGNLIEHVDTLGRSTRFEYGPFSRRTAKVLPDGSRYEFAYDTELRVTAVTGPNGAVWRYSYDAAGGLIGEVDFSGRALAYELDAVGRLGRRTNGADQIVEFERDAVGRIVARRAADTEITFRFDPAGRLAHAAGPDSTLEFIRDATGRVLGESSGYGSDYGTVQSEYDAVGRRVRRTTGSGAVSEWAYDDAGRARSLTTPGGQISFQYDALGRETGRVLGAAAISQAWDEAHRLTAQALWALPEGSEEYRLANSRTYRYAVDGALEQIDSQGLGTRRYELDSARRIVGVDAGAWTERYAYDSLGNLTASAVSAASPSPEEPPEQVGFEYDGGRIRRAGRTSYEYDAQGRRTKARRRTLSGQVREWAYQWDADDRLTLVTEPDGTAWRYRHDPIGRRVAKQRLATNGQVADEIRFSWDGTTLAEQTRVEPDGGRVVLSWDREPGTYRVATQLHRRFAAADDGADASETRLLAVIADPVGTPTELITADGTAVWRSGQTLWGERQRGQTTAYDCPLRFPGQYHDPETGWNYNYFRHYDPQTAQYTTPDPLGLEPAPNPYAYVGNPLTSIDPLGLAERAPLGERTNPFPDRGSAYSAARELAGVPNGTDPDFTWQVGGDVRMRGMEGYFYSPDQAHWGTFEQFEVPGTGSRVVVEHTDDPAGSHFHAGQPKGDATRDGVDFGWGSNSPRDEGFERYGKILKPEGDHHLFYNGGKMPVSSEGYSGE